MCVIFHTLSYSLSLANGPRAEKQKKKKQPTPKSKTFIASSPNTRTVLVKCALFFSCEGRFFFCHFCHALNPRERFPPIPLLPWLRPPLSQGCSASPHSDDNLFVWSATIFGPDETAWEGERRPEAFPTKSTPPTAAYGIRKKKKARNACTPRTHQHITSATFNYLQKRVALCRTTR